MIKWRNEQVLVTVSYKTLATISYFTLLRKEKYLGAFFQKKKKKKTSISLADWKRPWCCKRYWGQEKGAADDEMVRWHHWLNGQNLSNFHETVKDREAWRAAVHGVVKSWTRLRDWTKKRQAEIPWILAQGLPSQVEALLLF